MDDVLSLESDELDDFQEYNNDDIFDHKKKIIYSNDVTTVTTNKNNNNNNNNNKPIQNPILCPSCQPSILGQCSIHGKDALAHKCKYCCSPSFWSCWGNTHFCNTCHKPSVWQTLSTHHTGINKKSIHEYPQCSSLLTQINKLRSDTQFCSLSLEKQERIYFTLVSDPKTCPLGIRHPPNGISFATGCILCQSSTKDQKIDDINTSYNSVIEKNTNLSNDFLNILSIIKDKLLTINNKIYNESILLQRSSLHEYS